MSRPEPGISPHRGATRVRVAGLRKAYGDADALAGVGLEVEPGELLALLGPSGSGKTTLLRVIAGLEIPDAGRVFFGEEDVTDRPVQERGIGFVFQHYALFRHLSVFDNIAYGPRTKGRNRPAEPILKRRVGDLLGLVQLDGLGDRFPAQLSGGQRQRVALARALATEPRVLLLDEPFGALDARVRKDLRRWLKNIHRETGQTTVFVTHDQDEALELADRIAILNRGGIEQVASPDEIYDHPASAFVMSFVGESARVPIRVVDGTARLGRHSLAAPTGKAPDGDADLFLRPQDVLVGPGTIDGIPGQVRNIRRIGPARRAEIRLADVPVDLDVEIGDRILSAGDEVALTVVGGRVFPRT